MKLGMPYQEYTSSIGGKTFLPDSTSFFRNLFSSRKSLDTISSFRWASQLSCKVSISSLSNSFCSSDNVPSHSDLLNLEMMVLSSLAWSPLPSLLAAASVPAARLGCPKKDVMLASAFGFLVSVRATPVAALRLSDIARRSIGNFCLRD